MTGTSATSRFRITHPFSPVMASMTLSPLHSRPDRYGLAPLAVRYTNGAVLVTIDLPLEKLDVRCFDGVLLRLLTGCKDNPDNPSNGKWRSLIPYIHSAVTDQRERDHPGCVYFSALFSPSTIKYFCEIISKTQRVVAYPLPPKHFYRKFVYKALVFLYWSVNNLVHTRWLTAKELCAENVGFSLNSVQSMFRNPFARGKP